MKKTLFTLTTTLTTLLLIANCSGSTTNPTANLDTTNCTWVEEFLYEKNITERMTCEVSSDKNILTAKKNDLATIIINKSAGEYNETVGRINTVYTNGQVTVVGKVWTFTYEPSDIKHTMTLD